jgi:hypothetical protein
MPPYAQQVSHEPLDDDDVEDERQVAIITVTVSALPAPPWESMLRYLTMTRSPEAAVLACLQAADVPVTLRVLESCGATSVGRLPALLKRMQACGEVCLNGRRWELPDA